MYEISFVSFDRTDNYLTTAYTTIDLIIISFDDSERMSCSEGPLCSRLPVPPKVDLVMNRNSPEEPGRTVEEPGRTEMTRTLK